MNQERIRIMVTGAVQGVGFRPFVYRLAKELALTGWVSNSAQGVIIEVEGRGKAQQEFLDRLTREKPALATIQSLSQSQIEPQGSIEFIIRPSELSGPKSALVLADLATCEYCIRELFDPGNRRYLYPFTNCTHCGPRFSIIEALPYDRANTSMHKFGMCSECQREYEDPTDRRFHAQPNACPACGPRLELWDNAGTRLDTGNEALLQAARAMRDGLIVALKGIGGFQLLTDAANEGAVQRLRARKQRQEKPLATMFPSLKAVHCVCHVNSLEQELLLSPAAPIVLLKRPQSGSRSKLAIAPSVAPGNPSLGVMLPYSPVHHLLMHALKVPVVATSGNLSDEPICVDEQEALERLHGIADLFLVHNRPIVRHVDDSVVRVMLGREMLLRRARGYAPLPIKLGPRTFQSVAPKSQTILAVGAHLKNTVALQVDENVFLSQHIGDLENAEANLAFRKSVADLPQLYDARPQVMACDLHPEYLSTKFARAFDNTKSISNGTQPARCIGVQHHYAHVLSCMAEHGLETPVLGVSWDGTGLGTDGTIWGGEFLIVTEDSFERFAHLRQFRLPGGEAAIKEPRRSALGLLHELFGSDMSHHHDLMGFQHFTPVELQTLQRMLAARLNSPITSSAGRLFDSVAALLGLRQRASFEGQAAMDLEFAATQGVEDAYEFELRSLPVLDWEPLIIGILGDLKQGQSVGVIAAKFHNTLVEMIVAVARRARQRTVALTGGCFQNQYLTERTVRRLREEAFQPYWHQRVPPNDGGIALGQVLAAVRANLSQADTKRVTADIAAEAVSAGADIGLLQELSL